MCQKIKTTVQYIFFMWLVSWSHDISSFYYSDINLFLIDHACCKLCNIWLLLPENNSRSYHCTGTPHWRKKIVAVIAWQFEPVEINHNPNWTDNVNDQMMLTKFICQRSSSLYFSCWCYSRKWWHAMSPRFHVVVFVFSGSLV